MFYLSIKHDIKEAMIKISITIFLIERENQFKEYKRVAKDLYVGVITFIDFKKKKQNVCVFNKEKRCLVEIITKNIVE